MPQVIDVVCLFLVFLVFLVMYRVILKTGRELVKLTYGVCYNFPSPIGGQGPRGEQGELLFVFNGLSPERGQGTRGNTGSG